MAENNTAPEAQTGDTGVQAPKKASAKPKKVNVYIQRDSANGDPNYPVFINGRSYILPKDEEVEVPDFVAEEINRSRRAIKTQHKNGDKKRLTQK